MAAPAARRYAIDASTLLRIVTGPVPVPDDVQLVAPSGIRSQALGILLSRVQAGELTDAEARELHTRMTELRIRALGDRVSRWTAFRLAREHGWTTTADAEYLAVAQLQADALVTVDPQLAARADGVVPVAGLDALGGSGD
ncbi:MAG: type II toxin-antitoxin system VapC family toxin [Leifsonia sp.]|uniref:type II toxin-antitoxin system VapC family toxin n=1 Tax=Leifsonia sp. TaxID=1870902 RepID=UPI003F7F6150